MGQVKSTLKIVLSKILGVIIFLAMVLLVNILTYFFQNQYLEVVVKFLNSNLWILILMSALFMLAEIFWVLDFPLNLPAPFFSAVSSLFLISFILQLLSYIGISQNIIPASIINLLNIIIYPLVFFIVLITGYVKIYLSQKSKNKSHKKD